jgi:hypothetical protein
VVQVIWLYVAGSKVVTGATAGRLASYRHDGAEQRVQELVRHLVGAICIRPCPGGLLIPESL